MKAILPVAGKGTRLRPHTHTKAKSLVNVAGKTVLEHIIERLKDAVVEEYIFIIDENGQQIKDFMANKFPELNCSYYVQQERLGPAHAVALGAPSVKPGDDLLVVFNDTIFVTDLAAIPTICSNADGLIYSKEVEDYQRFGVNVVEGEFIVDMVEKPDTPISRLAQVGLYYMKDGAGFIAAIEATIAAGETVKGEYYLPAVFMRMIGSGLNFKAPEIDDWLDCGKPETLLEVSTSKPQKSMTGSIAVNLKHSLKPIVFFFRDVTMFTEMFRIASSLNRFILVMALWLKTPLLDQMFRLLPGVLSKTVSSVIRSLIPIMQSVI